MAAKGEQEVLYFGPGQPCAGLDYSLPYNCLAPNSLAPGTVNTTQINGFVCSSPWIANSPYPNLANGEFVIGEFPLTVSNVINNLGSIRNSYTIIITNIAIYYAQWGFSGPNNTLARTYAVIYSWLVADINAPYMVPGQVVSFVEVNQTLFFSGLMLNGVYSLTTNATSGNPTTVAQATGYVAGQYIAELAGRLILAQCRFPTGGGTGTNVLPTVAWSGVGLYSGSGSTDPWNPANVNNLATIGGFNELADVPDQISGLAGMGRSAIITRLQGLSQMDPNPGNANSGLQPFNFYHLWASPKGVGAYPGTVAQYGYTMFFVSDDNVYSMNLYNGPQPVGPRIIAKINADRRTAGTVGGIVGQNTFATGSWYLSSVVNIAGQLHYLVTFSAYNANLPASPSPTYTSSVYDYNVSENAWHIWNPAKYLQVNGSNFSGLAFSTAITQTADTFGLATLVPLSPAVFTQNSLAYLFFGTITSFGTPTSYAPTGNLFQFVPWDYDFNSNWINTLVSPVYSANAMPNSAYVFRGEVVTLGHKTTNRRLRIQADNAPVPFSVAPITQQQQGTATFNGGFQNSTASSSINWSQGANNTVPYMQGNYAPQGLPIQTYYADAVLTDEMIQANINSAIVDTANPWNSMPAFRLASVSFVLVDPKSTQA